MLLAGAAAKGDLKTTEDEPVDWEMLSIVLLVQSRRAKGAWNLERHSAVMQHTSGASPALQDVHIRVDATDHWGLARHDTGECTYFLAAQPRQSADLHGLCLFSLWPGEEHRNGWSHSHIAFVTKKIKVTLKLNSDIKWGLGEEYELYLFSAGKESSGVKRLGEGQVRPIPALHLCRA